MFKFLALFFFVQTISALTGCYHNRHRPGPWRHHHHNHESGIRYNRLNRDVVSLDQTLLDICNSTEKHLKEVFYSSLYKLSVSLPDVKEENIKIKRKHRVLYILAEHQEEVSFWALKVLPEHVNQNSGAWKFVNGELLINFVYQVPLGTERVVDCTVAVDDTEVTLPKALAIDARFGEDESTEIPLSENSV